MKKIGITFGVLLFVLSCGGGSTGKKDVSGQDIPPVEVAYEEGELGTEVPQQEIVEEPKKLLFDQDDDVDKSPCKPEKVCNILLSWNQKRELRVKVVQGNKGVEGETITYKIEAASASDLGTVAELASTDADGVAKNYVNSKEKDGDFRIKVCTTDPAVPCISYKVSISGKGQVPLIVRFKPYEGSYPQINQASIRIFKKEVAKCADLTVKNFNTKQATTGKEIALNETAFFNELNALLETQPDKIFEFTVFAVASVGGGVVQAKACDDETAKLQYKQQTKVVELALEDLMPDVAKTYRVINQFNLVNGLPPNVKSVVETIIGFFTDPVGEALLLFCKAGFAQNNDTLKSFCGYLFNDKNNPQLNDKTAIGEVVTKILNAVVDAVIEKYCPYKDNPSLCKDIKYAGQEIAKMLTEFKIISTIKLKQEPDANGIIPQDQTEEIWRTVVIKWSYGLDCPPEDENCGIMNLEFSAIPGVDNVVEGHFEAIVTKPGKNQPATITIKPHSLNLKYGALVNYAIEKLVLPKLFGPKVMSYEDLLGSLLGGMECLDNDDCCEQFAKKVYEQASGVTKSLLEGACTALIEVGSKYLRDKLISMDLKTGQNFTIGTKEPCPMYDDSQPPDMVIDKLGKKDKQCLWDAKLTIGGQTFPPTGSFYGKIE